MDLTMIFTFKFEIIILVAFRHGAQGVHAESPYILPCTFHIFTKSCTDCMRASWWYCFLKNKANLRDLIAATGLVILLKFDPIHRFFSPCDLEIWCMTLKNNRAPLLYYIKLSVSFQIHRWIQTKVTVRKRSIRVKIDDFFSRVT